MSAGTRSIRIPGPSGHRFRHGIAALGTVLTGMLLAWSPCAFALNPALDVSQYVHTSWKIRDGFCKGVINSIAQTPDGYLWLGTEFGLLRFDGVRPVLWQQPGQHLPGDNIRKLLVTRDGTLWVGTRNGLASWKAGMLTQYPDLVGPDIPVLLEDREGVLWAGARAAPTGRLCAIRNGNVQCYGGDGTLGTGVFGLHEDRAGNLWAGVGDGLWRWKPAPPRFYPLPGEGDAVQGFADENDALLISSRNGIRRLVNGKTETYPLPGTSGTFVTHRLLGDRDGGLWIGSLGRGVLHVHQGRGDVLAQSGGLSGDRIFALFEDREGDVWVATDGGLDRFRDSTAATFSANQGLSSATVASVLAARDGRVWLGTLMGLNRWDRGQVTSYPERGAGGTTEARAIAGSGVPDRGVGSLFQDDRGRVWISTSGGVGYLENDRFISISGIPGGTVHSIVGDTGGNLWIANQNLGLLRLSGSEVQETPWASLGHRDFATALAADPLQGGLWVGFFRSGLAYFKDGRIRASYAAAEGLGRGRVNSLRLDRDGTLWIATEGGLSRLKNSRVATLSGKNGLPCDAVHWSLEDDDHAFWLYMPCGLARIAQSAMDAWATDPGHTVSARVFDASDGVRSHATASGYTPQAGKSPDGKLWFSTLDGAGVVDPRHLSLNTLPPPVQIEQLTADRKPYDLSAGMRLPALIRDLQIDYTALSLAAPEKVKFRYKLEGHDRDWQDAGTRRQAFYNDLPPRPYRFRVIACNNSGVWNEAGAFLDFSVAPAYYQTRLFQASCVAAFLALLGGLYQLRVRQVARQFNLRMEERINERTRIARDFHDTLLQSFQGVLMKLSVVAYRIKDPPEVRQELETIVGQARRAVAEGRDAVQGLRSSTIVKNDLARAIVTFGEQLAADQTGQHCPEFRVEVEGTTKDLVPLVRDEVHRIACEAVRNAFLHAGAGRIEVEIHYAARQLRVLVRDNGKGIDQKILNEGGRTGHHGLPGMHERAKLAGGKLAVRSKLDSGTEVELTIPASLAYLKAREAKESATS